VSIEVGYHPEIKTHGRWMWPLRDLPAPQTLDEAIDAFGLLAGVWAWAGAERRVVLVVRAEQVMYSSAATEESE
jgi:hypothetical protein